MPRSVSPSLPGRTGSRSHLSGSGGTNTARWAKIWSLYNSSSPIWPKSGAREVAGLLAAVAQLSREDAALIDDDDSFRTRRSAFFRGSTTELGASTTALDDEAYKAKKAEAR